MRRRVAHWLFRLAYKLDHIWVGKLAVGIAPYYRPAVKAEAAYERYRATGMTPPGYDVLREPRL